jgi:hypothetical protein
MGRKLYLINDLVREYKASNNPIKDKIVEQAILQIKTLDKEGVKNENC